VVAVCACGSVFVLAGFCGSGGIVAGFCGFGCGAGGSWARSPHKPPIAKENPSIINNNIFLTINSSLARARTSEAGAPST